MKTISDVVEFIFINIMMPIITTLCVAGLILVIFYLITAPQKEKDVQFSIECMFDQTNNSEKLLMKCQTVTGEQK
jgi:hypothetical protein